MFAQLYAQSLTILRSWYEDQTFPVHLNTGKRVHNERYRPSIDLERDGQRPAHAHPSKRMEIDTEGADFYSLRSAIPPPDAMTNYNLRAKSFAEQQAVLSLRRLSVRDDPSCKISSSTINAFTTA